MKELRQNGECHGTIGHDVSVAGLRLVETVYRPGSQLRPPGHELSTFTLMMAGRYTAHGRIETWVCTPPAVLFHPAGDASGGGFDGDGGRWLRLELEPSWLSRHGWRGCEAPLCYRDGGRLAWLMVEMYRELQVMDGVSSIALEGLALDLMAATSRLTLARGNGKAGWLEQVEGILRENLAAPLRMREIATTVGVHPVSLARAFHRRFGLSAGEYGRKLRVEHASRELASSDKPVAAIASAAGFANKSHLTRTFKFHTGMTPREYRSVFRHARPRFPNAPPGVDRITPPKPNLEHTG